MFNKRPVVLVLVFVFLNLFINLLFAADENEVPFTIPPNEDPRVVISNSLCSAAEEAYSEGDLAEAMRLYREALIKKSDNLRAIDGLKTVDKAVKAGASMEKSKGAGLDSNQRKKIESMLDAALKETSKGNYAEAIGIYGEVLSIDPSNGIARRKIKLVRDQMETRKKIENQINELLEEADKLTSEMKYRKAESVYKKILKEVDPGNKAAKEGIVSLDLIKKERVEKTKDAKKQGYLKDAVYYRTIGEFKKAKESYEAVLRIDPSNVTALDGLKVIKLEQMQERQEIQVKAKRLDLENIDNLVSEAKEARENGDLSVAEKKFKKALKKDPDNKTAAEGLREIEEYRKTFEEKQKQEKQLEKETKKLKKQQKKIEKYLANAEKSVEKGKYEQALKHYRKVLELDNENREASSGIELVNRKIQEKEKLQQQKDLEKQMPGAKEKTEQKKLIKESNEQQKRLREKTEGQKNIDNLVSEAKEARENGDLSVAEKKFKKALKKDPDNKTAAEGLKEIEEYRKTFEEKQKQEKTA